MKKLKERDMLQSINKLGSLFKAFYECRSPALKDKIKREINILSEKIHPKNDG
ncbi:hypothetical protein [Bacillus sp. KH172YL63]|uniref:hypothetical protein n=1 Tax=Bacillus sp. KH172YL63 TaxID=2709784 RepID=UPI0015657D69|nr:hypothetical protein [Bacillus sp. KH172YL63]